MDDYKEGKLIDLELVLKKSGLGQGMTLLDVGCGMSGHFVFPAAKMVGKEGCVYALDILQPVLENIKKKAQADNLPQLKTIWCNIEVFQGSRLEAGSIDRVLLVNVLHQSKQRGAIMREVTRLAKKGATISVIEWKRIASPFGPKPEDRVDEKAIIEIANKLGLVFEEEYSAGKYHYGLIFQKI